MKHLVLLYFICGLMISCGNKQQGSGQKVKAETPSALKDNSLDISYSRSSSDLVDELYKELVDNTPELKKLEDDIADFDKIQKTPAQKFQSFDSKSSNYYSSANQKIESINDSLLRDKIISYITVSSNNYKSKTNELINLLNTIDKNSLTINDYHLVLKILNTIPLIEKYQVDNFPNKTEFKDIIINQQKLTKRIDSLTVKHL